MPTPDRYSEQLVLRLNELTYNDADAFYGELHETHLGVEGDRWRRLAPRFLPPSPLVLADIGTGMGMVPLAIADLLGHGDHVIASDISTGMLEVAQRNIADRSPAWSVEFVKLRAATPFTLPFSDASIDVLTMNSVLHHVKNTAAFLSEIDRVLRPGGVVVIAHEPNAGFHKRRLLWLNYQIIYSVLSPRYALRTPLARALGLSRLARAIYYRLRPEQARIARARLDQYNQQLMAEGIIHRPLGPDEVGEITDIFDASGFDPRTLIPDYTLLQIETYNHIGQVSIDRGDRRFIGAYDRFLARRFPESGMTFFASWRKQVEG